jgi:hypothetical protein
MLKSCKLMNFLQANPLISHYFKQLSNQEEVNLVSLGEKHFHIGEVYLYFRSFADFLSENFRNFELSAVFLRWIGRCFRYGQLPTIWVERLLNILFYLF